MAGAGLARSERGDAGRLAGVAVAILVLSVAGGFGVDRLIRELALRHHRATAPLGLAAAMGGLFAAGMLAVLLILMAARWGSRRTDSRGQAV